MEVGAQIIVTGLVQGVGYRWFVYNRATELGLRGSVENRGDGSVEVTAVGERPLIEELVAALRIGPRSARVRGVEVAWLAPAGDRFSGFEIR